MRIERIVLRHFRNYTQLDLDFSQNINLFIGNNAQGKTNILEAIYLLCTGKSHRTAHDADLIQWQNTGCSVDLFFYKQEVSQKIRFLLSRPQKRTFLFNGSPTRFRDLVGTVNAVLFSPEDLSLVKGAPNLRRHFLNVEISQADPRYYHLLLNYNRVLTQRNNLLRGIRESHVASDTLEEWDLQLAAYAAQIVIKRLATIKRLSMLARLLHRKISDNQENLVLEYAFAGEMDNVDTCKNR